MPAAPYLKTTVLQARAEVARRLGVPDDAEASPELIGQIRGLVGSVQHNLALEFRHLLPKLSQTIAITSGRSVYTLPCPQEGIVSVHAQITGASLQRLQSGIALADTINATPGAPLRYDLRQYQGVVGVTVAAAGTNYVNGASLTIGAPGAGGTQATAILTANPTPGPITGITITDPGSGYVTPPTVTAPTGSGATLTPILGAVDALLLNPSPGAAGSLYIEYRPIPVAILDDADPLVFDPESVIAVVAGTLATTLQTAMSGALVDQAKVAMDQMRRRVPMRPSGGGLSMMPNGASRG